MRWLKRSSKIELQRDYPIQRGLPGWFFRVEETSAGVYRAEGANESGHSVSRSGTNQDTPLSECEADARAIGDEWRAPSPTRARVAFTAGVTRVRAARVRQR